MSRIVAISKAEGSVRSTHDSHKREVDAGIGITAPATTTVADAQHRSCWSQEHTGTVRGRFADLCRARSVAEAWGWRAPCARGARNRPQRVGRCLNRKGVVGLQRALDTQRHHHLAWAFGRSIAMCRSSPCISRNIPCYTPVGESHKHPHPVACRLPLRN